MKELEFLAGTGLRGIDLVFFLIAAIAIVFMVKVAPRIIDRKTKLAIAKLEKEKQEFMAESSLLLENVSPKLNDMHEALNNAYKEREDMAAMLRMLLADQKKHAGEMNILTLRELKNSIYNDNILPLDRLYDLYDYIKLGGNHNCLDYAIPNLIRDNLDLWKSITGKPPQEHEVVDIDFYRKQLEKINRAFM